MSMPLCISKSSNVSYVLLKRETSLRNIRGGHQYQKTKTLSHIRKKKLKKNRVD